VELRKAAWAGEAVNVRVYVRRAIRIKMQSMKVYEVLVKYKNKKKEEK
jgi:hypothetical protein